MNNLEINIYEIKQKKINVFFTFVFLLGLYSGISFYITDDLFIPYIFCGVTAIYFFIMNLKDLKAYHLSPFAFLAVITFIGIIFSDQMSEYFFERIKGFVQLFYSIIISFVFYLNLRKWKIRAVSSLFFVLIIIILIGTCLEIFTDFKDISDDLREKIFKGNLYDADLRDIYFYGMIRPKLFTEEPSHVAKFYLLCLFVWFSLSDNRVRYVIMFLFTALGIVLIRSHLILIIIPISIVVEAFYRKKIRLNFKIKYKGIFVEKSFAILIILITIMLISSINTIVDKRVDQIISGDDDSFKLRFTGPIIIAYEVLKKYPIFGAGISGKEAIEEIINNVYYNLDVKYYSVYSFSTNLIMSYFIYFGVFGGIIFGIGIYILVKRQKIIKKNLLFIIFIFFSQTMGGFVSMRPWGYFFIIAAVTSFSSYYERNIPKDTSCKNINVKQQKIKNPIKKHYITAKRNYIVI